MLSGVVFVLALWNVKGSYIDVTTNPTSGSGDINLTQYGYMYQTKADCLAHFTFQVKACSNVAVHLLDANSQIVVILNLGNQNDLSTEFVSIQYLEENVLDCNSYRRFWIAWRNNVVMAGRGDQFNNDTLLSVTSPKQIHVRLINILTYLVIGQWKIPDKQPPLHCYRQTGWMLSPGLMDTNMTANITWSVTADNLGQCALTCTRSSSCMSFVYNERKVCQGHGQTFKNITEGQGHKHSGSHYYIKP